MRTLLVLMLLIAAAPSQTPAVAGPMLGHVSHEEAVVWLGTRDCETVQLRYWDVSTPAEKKTETAASPVTARISLRGLTPGTEYAYEILLDGKRLALDRPLRFRTQRHWRYRTDAPDVTVAIGSCAYVNDPAYDRPGEAYGGDPQIFERIADTKPDLMLWLGDNVYFREPDWTSMTGMFRRYFTNRRVPQLQRLLSCAANYAIWDDHDFGPNDSDRSYPLKHLALRTFRAHWANPPRAGENASGGVYTSFTWSDVEFFLLDDRWFRSPNREPVGPDKVMFGAEQMQWLVDALTGSTATFKVVAGGNQLLNPMTPYECWGAFPRERERFLQQIHRRRIEGLVFLSGDRHHAELIRVDRDGAYPLFDYTSSPLLSSTHHSEREKDNPARVAGTWIHDQRNFGLLRFTGPRTDRKVVLEARGEDGKAVWTHTITREELRYPREK